MKKTIVTTDKAPSAIGPYSQAVIHNGMVYVSGQIALDPESMEVVGDSVEEQALQVMKNLSAVLKAAGCSLEDVLKCTLYLADMGDFQKVNSIYGRYFQEDPPAREAVAVKTLPKNVQVEISCFAALSE